MCSQHEPEKRTRREFASVAAAAAAPAPAAPSVPAAAGEDLPASPIDGRCTFDNFVVGKPNELAHAAARRVERMNHLTESAIRPISMDVTDDSSTQAAVEKIIADTGRIDVLVNNAGYGSYGALEDVPMDEARYQFEVNVFGAARLTQLVLPHMRERGSGAIVMMSSVGGQVVMPGFGVYCATKFGLEAVAEAMHLGLTIPLEDRQARWRRLLARVKEGDVVQWRQRFVEALKQAPVPALEDERL